MNPCATLTQAQTRRGWIQSHMHGKQHNYLRLGQGDGILAKNCIQPDLEMENEIEREMKYINRTLRKE